MSRGYTDPEVTSIESQLICMDEALRRASNCLREWEANHISTPTLNVLVDSLADSEMGDVAQMIMSAKSNPEHVAEEIKKRLMWVAALGYLAGLRMHGQPVLEFTGMCSHTEGNN